MSAIPLPDGSNAADMIRRLRAIDAEIFGTLYANAGIIGGDVTIEGTLTGNDILSSNWDGTIPVDLSGGADGGATAGYALDGSAGAAQFQTIYAESGEFGNFDILGTLTMGAGGVLRTAASGQRLELAESFGDRINWYTADASESSPGTLFGFYAGAAGTGHLQLNLHSPQNTTRSTQTRLELKAQSASGASGPEVTVYATGTYNIQPVARFVDFIMRVDDGTESAPGFAFNSSIATGMYLLGANILATATGAGTRMYWDVNGTHLVTLGTTGSAANLFADTALGNRIKRSTASSRAYKTDIQPLTNPPIVHASTFHYIPGYVDDDPKGKVMHYGFIAQDVQAALGDDSVTYNEDGSVDDYNWKHIIATLEARIAILEARE